MTLQQQLKSMRQQAGLTQKQLAEKLKTSQSTINMAEKGYGSMANPSIGYITEWAKVCGYSVAIVFEKIN